MVSMVAAALVIAGAVTFAVTIHTARTDNRHELLSEAKGLAISVQSEAATARPKDPAASLRTIIRALKGPLKLQGAAVVAITAGGVLFNPLKVRQPPILPSGITADDLDVSVLLGLHAVSGTVGGVVYAAAPYRTPVKIGRFNRDVVQVVVLTRRPPTGLAAAGPWFLVAAAAIILLAVLVADRLGRRIVAPLRAVEVTTGRIAAGDLDARVPVPPGVDPELASLAASVNTMADGLARSRGVERQFLLSVSHDLRTPLTSIRGFAEAIEDGVTSDVTRAGRIIVTEARRLERLVGDLLDLARLESRQFSLSLRPVDLAEVVADTAGGFGPAASELGLQLEVPSARDSGSAWGDGSAGGGGSMGGGGSVGGGASLLAVADPDRLAQVVANLVENALSFAHSTVRVGAAPSGGLPVLWVDDDGPGISPVDLPRVFDRLYSSRPSQRESTRPAGSGLGLAIVAELVAAMGGAVRAESPVPGMVGGTRMVVTLRPVG